MSNVLAFPASVHSLQCLLPLRLRKDGWWLVEPPVPAPLPTPAAQASSSSIAVYRRMQKSSCILPFPVRAQSRAKTSCA
jgi:hypothetical protein